MPENNLKESENKSKFPKSVPFLLCNVFLERFCSAGVLTILPLFLHNKLGLDKNSATSFYHVFDCVTLLFTVVGAICADLWFGLYKSILLMSFIYACGLAMISIGMIEPLNLPVESFVIVGLLIVAIGCGSIKATTNVFSGNQHKMPEQERQLQLFFSASYFAAKSGSLISRLIFPVLRADVKCFGNNDCYAVTFGTPMIIMLIATLILLCGSAYYIHVPSNGNALMNIIKCTTYAIFEKRRQKKEGTSVDQHWLSYAKEKYGRKLVLETKVTIKVLIMFLPIPMFWALHMQQSSRWIFQASQMNGDIGFYRIKPDQMIVFNSVLALILVPVFEKFLYPYVKSLLTRILIGCFCVIIAIILAAIVETQVQRHYISMLWQVPQFFAIATAENITYLSHLNFAYKEAPLNMKPVMVAFMFLTMSAGNAIVAIVSGSKMFNSQVNEYFFFAFLMMIDILFLSYLSSKYKYTDHEMIKALGEEDDAVIQSDKNIDNKV